MVHIHTIFLDFIEREKRGVSGLIIGFSPAMQYAQIWTRANAQTTGTGYSASPEDR